MTIGLDAFKDALDRRAAHLDIWWRDDDAGASHPRLQSILDLASAMAVPVALAIVPASLERSVVELVVAARHATVLQHGWAHADHAPRGERRIELGGTCDPQRLFDDLAAGRERLAAAFGPQSLPIMVPPWNRASPSVEAMLPTLGFIGISKLAGTDVTEPSPLPRMDVHVDPLDRRLQPRPDLGSILVTLADLVDAMADHPRPLGLMTHHRAMSEDDLAILRQLIETLVATAGTSFRPVAELMAV